MCKSGYNVAMDRVNTKLTMNLEKTELEEKYDAACKALLSEKVILARIMKGCIEEYKDCSIEEIENYIEQMRDQMLEPLKDEEDSLQLEKDTLESQIQVAKADYEACQKMEQADVKMLTPNYTGGQG